MHTFGTINGGNDGSSSKLWKLPLCQARCQVKEGLELGKPPPPRHRKYSPPPPRKMNGNGILSRQQINKWIWEKERDTTASGVSVRKWKTITDEKYTSMVSGRSNCSMKPDSQRRRTEVKDLAEPLGVRRADIGERVQCFSWLLFCEFPSVAEVLHG